MKSLLVIVNGIKSPYHLVEHVLSEAKAHSASLHALFLKAEKENSPGYGFPSDLAQVEVLKDSEDALQADERIIRHHIELVEDMAATEHISCTTELRTDCTLSEVLDLVKHFDIVYLDEAFDDNTPSLLTSNRFTAQELITQAASPVKLIS